jgi:hypothetical protein
MKRLRKRIILQLLRIFSMPKVRHEIARYAKAFAGEANRYTTGLREEAAGTRDAFQILARYIRKERLSKEDKKQFQRQIYSLLKGIGVFVPPMLIPLPFVGTILLIIMDRLLLSMNIQILPASFYPEDKKMLLTPVSVEEVLEEVLKQRD